MPDLLVRLLNLLVLDGPGSLALISEALQDWVESHLPLEHFCSEVALYSRSGLAERTLGTLAALIAVQSLLPLLHALLLSAYQHQ